MGRSRHHPVAPRHIIHPAPYVVHKTYSHQSVDIPTRLPLMRARVVVAIGFIIAFVYTHNVIRNRGVPPDMFALVVHFAIFCILFITPVNIAALFS